MKIFIGGSVSDNIDDKYIKQGDKLVEFILKNDFDILCCADLRGFIGKLYKQMKEKADKKITLTVPKVYLKYAKDIEDKIDIFTNTINERTDESIKNSDVCLFMPGGIGTIYEIMSTIETKRAGEHNNKIIIVNLYGYYDEFIKMLGKTYSENFTEEIIRQTYKIVNSIEEAIDYIKK